MKPTLLKLVRYKFNILCYDVYFLYDKKLIKESKKMELIMMVQKGNKIYIFYY